ncbi:hypothetical protein MCETHM1_02825 [Flavobacteriaceae bacterium]
MVEIKNYVGVVLMIFFLVMSFFLKDVITRELCVMFSIIIGAIIFREIASQEAKLKRKTQKNSN